MTLTLLATKYRRPPPAPDLVARPRLRRLLAAARASRLILIAAPAGFGKTSLLAEWLAEGPEEAGGGVGPGEAGAGPPAWAWLSLDQGDVTPEGFWAYVIAALQTAEPRLGLAALAALQSPQPPPVEAGLAALINDLAGLERRLTLVLDDYHLITSPAIHQSLDYLLAHQPESLQLVIATREDPPLALSRLRARGQLAEVRAADLRFSPAEAGQFLNGARGLGLAPADVGLLAERTEGWAAGLRLAALSLQQAADRPGFVAAFSASHRFVSDYLVDEVLARLDPATQRFLRRTAVLHRLCAPLCDALLGEGGSEQRLQQLAQANLFLAPLDDSRRWYRYHHLFAELLRLQLLAGEPGLVPDLYRRAIDWCSAQGLLREALGYALDARDHERAAEALAALAPEVLSHEGPAAVLHWLAALPEALVRRRPRLCAAAAWALGLAGRMAEAERYLAAAEAALAAEPPAERPALAGQIAAHRAYLRFFHGAFAEARAAAAQALDLLPEGELVLRARAALVLSSLLRFAGQLAAAEAVLAPLAGPVRLSRNAYTSTMYAYSLAEIRQEQGRLGEALETFAAALADARAITGHPDGPFTGFAQIGIGHIQWERGELDAAEAALARGVGLCRAWQQADTLAIGLIELARLHLDRGEHDAARRALDELRQIAGLMASPWGIATADAWQARLDLARGDLAAARRWLQAAGLADPAALSVERIDDWESAVQVMVAVGDLGAALAALAPLVEQLRAAGRADRLLSALVWQARALAAQGQRAAAAAALDEALALGEPAGYVRSFVAGGPLVAELIGRRAGAYAARILAAFPDGGGRRPPPAPAGPATLAEPLSERELAVLRLMAAGRPNREIGDELYLSVNTVRWYASQLFAKLGVAGRGAAVARARELGIV